MTDSDLSHFIDTVCSESRLRVEADLGDGFVRLRSSEAERRQAAQDIRSSEDIVIELLRNARDAGARHIFLATQRTEGARLITVIDDGDGIPAALHDRIFEPRVTSKLDTAHMDKWGMHGRGMALYSISANARYARVARSAPGLGTSISVETDLSQLGEKTDQSTFPRFEASGEGSFCMRGPKNILRTAAEFALEHRNDCAVHIGTPVDIAATLYEFGMATTSAALRAFPGEVSEFPLVKQPALLASPDDLAAWCDGTGLPLSARSARRILDGTIGPASSLTDRLQQESFPTARASAAPRPKGDARKLRLADEDAALLADAAEQAMGPIARRYFLDGVGRPHVSATPDAIRITIPIHKMD